MRPMAGIRDSAPDVTRHAGGGGAGALQVIRRQNTELIARARQHRKGDGADGSDKEQSPEATGQEAPGPDCAHCPGFSQVCSAERHTLGSPPSGPTTSGLRGRMPLSRAAPPDTARRSGAPRHLTIWTRRSSSRDSQRPSCRRSFGCAHRIHHAHRRQRRGRSVASAKSSRSSLILAGKLHQALQRPAAPRLAGQRAPGLAMRLDQASSPRSTPRLRPRAAPGHRSAPAETPPERPAVPPLAPRPGQPAAKADPAPRAAPAPKSQAARPIAAPHAGLPDDRASTTESVDDSYTAFMIILLISFMFQHHLAIRPATVLRDSAAFGNIGSVLIISFIGTAHLL